MANPDHLEILRQGVTIWNEWIKNNLHIKPDLYKADLSIANLSGAYLYKANLSEAKLCGADLEEAYLSEADLSKADLSGAGLWKADLSVADLSGADLSGADLSEANLAVANLSGANLSEADLSDADFFAADLSRANLSKTDFTTTTFNRANLFEANTSQAIFSDTVFADTNLTNVSGLENIIHNRPSSIGIDTIFRSGGKIPHKFLEGAGVPDVFIEYMDSMCGQPFQFYSCFISHSNKDKEFADRIYADLRKESVRCWFAPEDMKAGKKLHHQIDEAIRIHDKLLLILSESSINSDWVANEIKWARKREKQEGKQKLFPVRLIDFEKLNNWVLFDADTAIDLAAEVRSYYIPDFSTWKTDHDRYLKEFKKLLKALESDNEW